MMHMQEEERMEDMLAYKREEHVAQAMFQVY